MSDERKGDWIQTYTGIQFWPLDPRPEEVRIEGIAHALSLQCRFGGHCRKFYSVAEHCVRVSWTVTKEYALWGLLHDAAEAYLVDLPRPIKRWSKMGQLYLEAERALMGIICIAFNLPETEPDCIKKADTVLLVTEKRDLMTMEPKPWEDTETPLREIIQPWCSKTAERMFLQEAKIFL